MTDIATERVCTFDGILKKHTAARGGIAIEFFAEGEWLEPTLPVVVEQGMLRVTVERLVVGDARTAEERARDVWDFDGGDGG